MNNYRPSLKVRIILRVAEAYYFLNRNFNLARDWKIVKEHSKNKGPLEIIKSFLRIQKRKIVLLLTPKYKNVEQDVWYKTKISKVYFKVTENTHRDMYKVLVSRNKEKTYMEQSVPLDYLGRYITKKATNEEIKGEIEV